MTSQNNKKLTALLPTFGSMGACAGATGIPTALLRNAKRGGCSAFHPSGRVHLAPLLTWLFADDKAETSTDWHQRFKRAQAIGLEHRMARERGALVEQESVSAAIQKSASDLKTMIFQEIEQAPMKLAAAGTDVPGNREIFADVLWDFFGRFGESMAANLNKVDAENDAAMHAILNPKPATEKSNENKKRKKK